MENESETDLPDDILPITAQELAELRAAPPSMWYSAKDACIRIPVPNASAPVTEYCVDLIRLRTTKELLAWTVHLATKPWMPRQRLREFIRLVAKERRFKLPYAL